ncbi:MAG: protease [Planctomycetota bacterium]|nr:MAG: protease [Planctomycetota bacterium]
MRAVLLSTAVALLLAPAVPLHAQDEAVAARPLVVELTINGSVGEEPTPPQPFGPQRRNFRAKLERLRELSRDPAVAAVELKLKGSPDHARSLDLLVELAALKARGKKVVCYTEVLTRSDLVFAGLADLLVVPPTGMIVLEGYAAEVFYMKDLLAKFDARAEVLHIGDFKTAYENFAKDAMSAGQREVLEQVLQEFSDQTLGLIAQHRGMSTEAVEAMLAGMLVEPEQAAKAGLIDAALYEDDYNAHVAKLLGAEFERDESYGEQSLEELEKMLNNPFAAMTMLAEALNPPKQKKPSEPYVAVVYASGAIQSGKSKADFAGNVASMGSETIVEALRATESDEHCKAVVLRVNSPGGSALASDMIYRAVQQVQAAGKPVVASMGSLAASGGYWISMGADVIVAQPSTLTGSIGVVSMVPDLHETLAAAGVKVETVSVGPQGDQLSITKYGVSPLLRDVLTRSMESTYDRFLLGVSKGRKLPVERVRELAGGRVWTGRQAEANGLVDELGGFQDALDLAAVLAGLEPDKAPLVEYPQAPSFFEQIEEAMGDMVTVRTPLEELADSLGFGAQLAHLRALMSEPRALHPDRVQALLPFHMVVR